jgi:hypothetical protein
VLRAAALVGVLDGLFAIAMYVWVLHLTTPVRLFQGIARSLLGPAAMEGGTPAAMLGVAIHFGVAYGWTVVYALLLSGLPWLREQVRDRRGAIGVGVLYGMIVWTTMDLLIVPLTRTSATPFLSWYSLVQLLGHPLSVGLPIALLVRPRR